MRLASGTLIVNKHGWRSIMNNDREYDVDGGLNFGEIAVVIRRVSPSDDRYYIISNDSFGITYVYSDEVIES